MSKYNKNKINLSQHSIERAWERFRMDRSQLIMKANKALDDGSDLSQDPVMKEMTMRRVKKHKPSGMYMLDGIVYIFKDDTLATVLPVEFLYDPYDP